MPLGILTDEDFKSELDNLDKPVRAEIKEIKKPGRKDGDNNVPESARKLIGAESIEGNRKSAIDLANRFGISPQSVDAYSNGSTSLSSYHTPNPELKAHLIERRRAIANTASERLQDALSELTVDKISAAKARDISGIAKDLSSVVKNMEPSDENNGDSKVQFVVFAPQIKKDESSFSVIDVNE